MTMFMNLIAGTALLFALSGCEFRKVAINDLISPQQIEFIEVGKTTSSEVVAQFLQLESIDECRSPLDRPADAETTLCI